MFTTDTNWAVYWPGRVAGIVAYWLGGSRFETRWEHAILCISSPSRLSLFPAYKSSLRVSVNIVSLSGMYIPHSTQVESAAEIHING